MRSLSYIALVWVEKRFHVDPPWYCVNVIIVMLTMGLADLTSRSVGHTSKTITNLKSPVYAKLFFSSIQVASYVLTLMLATGHSHLIFHLTCDSKAR